MSSVKYSGEYSYKNSSSSNGATLGDDSAHGTDEERLTSAFSSSPSLPLDISCTTPGSAVSDFVEYQNLANTGGGSLRAVKKSFISSSTSTKSTRYGSNGSLKEKIPDTRESLSPMPARSSSSMSKLNQVEEKTTTTTKTSKPVIRTSPSGGYSYMVQREETTTTRTTTPTSTGRKVKFSDKEVEFKDIDVLPDPDLDKDISLYSCEKKHHHKTQRIKMDDEKFDYNDFALVPPTASRSPLPHRKNEVRNRSPSPSIDPRAPSPIHQLTVPPKFMEVRTPSPKDKIESEHNCKYHSHHLDYKYTPPPVKGPCIACGQYIVGSLVTALDQMWHPECFTCVNCDVILKAHNYVVEDGKQYCKDCHLRLFGPPCSVCHKPTQSNRYNLLNRIWHPECFCCVECGKRLTPDNYIERLGSPYCKEDYHRLFSPKCCVCHLPIKDKAINALGKMWHPHCFKCTHCGIPLEERNFYEKNGLPYCEKDYMDLFHPKCWGCKKPITDGRQMMAMGKPWHPECFRCTVCVKPLTPDNFFEKDGKPYCEKDYHNLFSPKCAGCHNPITDGNSVFNKGKYWHPDCDAAFNRQPPPPPPVPDLDIESLLGPLQKTESKPVMAPPPPPPKPKGPDCFGCSKPIEDDNYITAMGHPYHPKCFKCTECRKPLNPYNFYEKNGLPYCEDDYHKLFSPKCEGCKEPIKDSNYIRAMGKNWHPDCFQCDKCRIPLNPENFYEKNGKPYCEDDYNKLFSPKCCACNKPIKGKPVFALGKEWHPTCFVCSHPRCDKILSPDDFEVHDGKPYCKNHFQELFLPKCFACKKPITDKVVSALGKTWHPECFACVQCNTPLDLNSFREKDGLPYCEADYHALFSPKCAACEAPIIEKCLTALGKTWHPEHFTCQHCNKMMSDDPDGYHEHDGKGYCRPCYIELFAPYCRGCNKPIVDKICVTALNSKYHQDCFVCRDCSCPLKNGNYFEFEGEPYCEEHFRCKMCPDCVKLRRAQNKYFGSMNGGPQKVVTGVNGVQHPTSIPHTHTAKSPLNTQQRTTQYSIRLGA